MAIKRIDNDLRRRNHLVVGIAEFVAARAVIGVAQFVDRDREGILGNRCHHFAVLNLVRRGGSLVTVAHRVTVAARGCGARANMPDVALTFGSVADAELLASHVIAHPEGFAHDERLELGVAQRGGAFLLEVGHGHAGGRILARVGARGVPDGRRSRRAPGR